MNGFDSGANLPLKHLVPLLQHNLTPHPVEDINKWDTLHPTENFELEDLDGND